MLPAGRRHQHAVADELVHAHDAVHADPDLRSLTGLAQHRDLVDGERLARLAVDRRRPHAERMQRRAVRAFQPRRQVLERERVHQEADRAPAHAVDRRALAQEAVLRLQHEAVATQSDDDVGLGRLGERIAGGDLGKRGLGIGGAGCDGGHPPVTHGIPRWAARGLGLGGGGSAAGHAHVAADRRARVAAVDDEVVALGLAPDRLMDRGNQRLVALAPGAAACAGRPRPPGRGTCRACRCR